MEERTESGERKIDAAMRAAGTFVDLLRPELMDRAGVVAFNSEAHVMQALTTSPEALKAALSRVTTAPQTCIPCAIETAMQVFDGDRRPTALPVLILLTDGRSNPRPVGEAIALSKAAKDAGVTVFTVALGQDVETDALMAMASYPAAFISVADAGSLSRAFELIAQTIPCMPHQFWGGR
jgi:Mg-chelatase subunit ChlD